MFNTLLYILIHIYILISVLDIKSQYIPEVVVVRRGAIGVWGAGEGGWVNWVRGTSGVSLQAT
jgi:hypothetical protein